MSEHADPPPAAPAADLRPATVYGGLWRRFLAGLIDSGLGFVLMVIVLAAAAPGFGTNRELSEADQQTTGLLALGCFSVWFNYMALGEWRWGRTVGKRALGLRVKGEPEGERPSWNRILARNLLRFVDLVLGWFSIPSNPQKRRLGDRAGHTVVIRTKGVS